MLRHVYYAAGALAGITEGCARAVARALPVPDPAVAVTGTETAGPRREDELAEPDSSLVPIVVLGESGIGKTAVIAAWAAGGAPPAADAPHPPPTLGADVFTREVAVEAGCGGKAPTTTTSTTPSTRRPPSAARRVTVQAWDVGGRPAAALLGRAFWAGAAAAVLAYDPCVAGGPAAVLDSLDHFLGVLEARAAVAGRRPPVVVLAIVRDGNGARPPAAALAAARTWCAARARAPHFCTALGGSGGGEGGESASSAASASAALDAAVRAGLAYAESSSGRSRYWGGGDSRADAAAALAGLAGAVAKGGGSGGGGGGGGSVAVTADAAAAAAAAYARPR